ncbi:hypothetical protein [Aureliella helgolandensis]|nr:hypothetical protein [Aureliella helgolandensis]
MPLLNGAAWTSVVVIGLCMGGCVLLGTASAPKRFASKSGGLKGRALIGLLSLAGAILLALPLLAFDWLIPSLLSQFMGWPPESSLDILTTSEDQPYAAICWLLICPLVFTASRYASLLLLLSANRPLRARTHRPQQLSQRVVRRIIPGATTFTMLATLIVVEWQFLKPSGVAKLQPLEYNAYQSIGEAGAVIEQSDFSQLRSDWETASLAKLVPSIQSIEPTLTQLHDLLQSPCRVPVDYTNNDLSWLDAASNFRSASRALVASGRCSLDAGEWDKASTSFLDACRLGVSVRHGGLLIDYLVGISCTSIGSVQLYEHRHLFPQQLSRSLAHNLATMSNQLEEFTTVQDRDRAWTLATGGWHARLQLFIYEAAGNSIYLSTGYLRDILPFDQAGLRLLAMEFALQDYYFEHRQWPREATELVPVHLERLPIDPFDAQQGALRYVRTVDGYLLYSVGANGTDDGGQAPPEDDRTIHYPSASGDIQAADYFTLLE